MRRETLKLCSAVVALMAVGCQPAERNATSDLPATANSSEVVAAPSDPQQLALTARDALFRQLSTRLIQAMSSGGPAAAIEVCSHDAPKLAASVGQQYGVAIGRTSFQLRNPKNAPPEWARPLIEKRSEQPEFVSLPNGNTGALLPIKLQVQCLVCHGPSDRIADDVKAKLAELYPEDQAIGFQEGDLRGWFWVVVSSRGNEATGQTTTSAE